MAGWSKRNTETLKIYTKFESKNKNKEKDKHENFHEVKEQF